MVAPTTFLTFTNPDTKYVLSTPNYPDMELLDPYEKGAPQSVKKSRELSHSKAHIRAHLGISLLPKLYYANIIQKHYFKILLLKRMPH